MHGAGFQAPLGFRLFTPDDWVIRIRYHDGTVVRKGVDGKVDQDDAMRVALNATRGREIPADAEIRRRRDWSKVQG